MGNVKFELDGKIKEKESRKGVMGANFKGILGRVAAEGWNERGWGKLSYGHDG